MLPESYNRDEDLELKRLLLPLIKRWKLFVLIGLLGGVMGFFASFHFLNYKSKGALFISDKDSGAIQAAVNMLNFGSLTGLGAKNASESYIRLFASDEFQKLIAKEVLESESLDETDKQTIQALYQKYVEQHSNSTLAVAPIHEWLSNYISQNTKLSVDGSNIINVQVSTTSKNLSHKIMNLFLDSARNFVVDRETKDLRLASEYLNEKIKIIEVKIKSLSQKMLQTQEENPNSGSVNGFGGFYDSGLGKLKESYEEIETRIKENQNVIKSLIKESTSDSTSVRALISNIKSENKILVSRANSLKESIEEKEKEKGGLLKSVHFLTLYAKELEFEAQNLQLHNQNLAKVEILELSVRSRFQIQNYSKIEDVERKVPVYVISLVTAFLFLVVLTIGVIIMESFYPTINTHESYVSLGGEFLGSIGFLKGSNALGIVNISTYSLPPEPINISGIQNFKSLRSRIENKLEGENGDETKVISILSSEPKAGKTVIASNLAWAMALSGKKVLLIDGDTYNPKTTERFLLEKNKGLTDLLSNDTNNFKKEIFSHIFQYDDKISSILGSLHVLPKGTNTSNLGAWSDKKLKTLIEELKNHYDRIVIDTSPILLIQDCREIHSIADLLLMVSDYGKTTVKEVSDSILNLPQGVTKKLFHLINKSHIDSMGVRKLSTTDYASYYRNTKPFKKVA